MQAVCTPAKLKVAFVSSETEHSLVGGLAEVAKSLPEALAGMGADITRFSPLHGVVWHTAGRNLSPVRLQNRPAVRLGSRDIGVSAFELAGSPVRTIYYKDDQQVPGKESVEFPGIRDLLAGQRRRLSFTQQEIEDACFSRFFYKGRVYPKSVDLRLNFLFATYAFLELLKSGGFGRFDVVHFNDWHFSLVPALITHDPRYREMKYLATLGTLHGLVSESYPVEEFEQLTSLYRSGHPALFDAWKGLLHNGTINFLKGLQYADMANTVSPTYARELLTSERSGDLNGLFRYLTDLDRFRGVLNGIDPRWSPDNDHTLPAAFSAADLSGKQLCKEKLREAFGLTDHSKKPLIGVLSRIVPDKGFDILLPCIDALARQGIQFAIFGSGDNAGYLEQLSGLSKKHQGTVSFKTGYEDKDTISPLIYSGSDVFLRPSRTEPCGLSHMAAMMCGSVPVVHFTGGLADTVFDIDEHPDTGNGFLFREYSSDALMKKLFRALFIFEHETALWGTLISRVMKADHSWGARAGQYLELYEKALENALRRNGK